MRRIKIKPQTSVLARGHGALSLHLEQKAPKGGTLKCDTGSPPVQGTLGGPKEMLHPGTDSACPPCDFSDSLTAAPQVLTPTKAMGRGQKDLQDATFKLRSS